MCSKNAAASSAPLGHLPQRGRQALPPTGGGWHGFAVTDGGDLPPSPPHPLHPLPWRGQSCHAPQNAPFFPFLSSKPIFTRLGRGRASLPSPKSTQNAAFLPSAGPHSHSQKSKNLYFFRREIVDRKSRKYYNICIQNGRWRSVPLAKNSFQKSILFWKIMRKYRLVMQFTNLF